MVSPPSRTILKHDWRTPTLYSLAWYGDNLFPPQGIRQLYPTWGCGNVRHVALEERDVESYFFNQGVDLGPQLRRHNSGTFSSSTHFLCGCTARARRNSTGHQIAWQGFDQHA